MTNESRWDSGRAGKYDDAWAEMAASGRDPHGEVAFIHRYEPTTALDAGCGTGRVAIELVQRGVDTVGVDLDAAMLEQARIKAPSIEWHQGDLADLDLRSQAGARRRFDVVVLAGNVMLFVAAGTEEQVVTTMADHVAPGGVLIAGFGLQRGFDLADYDRFATEAGYTLEERYRTWAGDPWEASADYAVSVHSPPKLLG